MKEEEYLYSQVEVQTGPVAMEINMDTPQKYKNIITIWSMILILKLYPKDSVSLSQILEYLRLLLYNLQ